MLLLLFSVDVVVLVIVSSRLCFVWYRLVLSRLASSRLSSKSSRSIQKVSQTGEVKNVEWSVVDHLDGGRGGAVDLCSLLEMGDPQVWSVCSGAFGWMLLITSGKRGRGGGPGCGRGEELASD